MKQIRNELSVITGVLPQSAVRQSSSPQSRSLQSCSRLIRNELSVITEGYHGLQSCSGWIRNQLGVELNGYRGPQSCSRWIRNEQSVITWVLPRSAVPQWTKERGTCIFVVFIYLWFLCRGLQYRSGRKNDCGTVVIEFENTLLSGRFCMGE